MENIKNNRIQKILNNIKTKYIIGTILLIGIGVTLPQIFHVLAGNQAGATYLPMHIAMLIAALVFGVRSSVVVAGSSVIISFLLTGMPSIARMPYMAIELIVYAIVLSLLNKKYSAYISLFATIILGRIIYAGILFVASNIVGLNLYGITVVESVITAIPGIIIQLAFIPFIAKHIKKGLKIDV